MKSSIASQKLSKPLVEVWRPPTSQSQCNIIMSRWKIHVSVVLYLSLIVLLFREDFESLDRRLPIRTKPLRCELTNSAKRTQEAPENMGKVDISVHFDKDAILSKSQQCHIARLSISIVSASGFLSSDFDLPVSSPCRTIVGLRA